MSSPTNTEQFFLCRLLGVSIIFSIICLSLPLLTLPTFFLFFILSSSYSQLHHVQILLPPHWLHLHLPSLHFCHLYSLLIKRFLLMVLIFFIFFVLLFFVHTVYLSICVRGFPVLSITAIQVGQLGQEPKDTHLVAFRLVTSQLNRSRLFRYSNFFKDSKVLMSFSLFPLTFRCVRFRSFFY